MANVSIPITKLDERSVLRAKIKITNQFTRRVKVAAFFIRMASRVLGCGFAVEFDDDNSNPQITVGMSENGIG